MQETTCFFFSRFFFTETRDDGHFALWQTFKLTNDVKARVLNEIGNRTVSLIAVRDWEMGRELADFLDSNGIKITENSQTGMYASAPPHKKPVQISLSGDHANIILDPS